MQKQWRSEVVRRINKRASACWDVNEIKRHEMKSVAWMNKWVIEWIMSEVMNPWKHERINERMNPWTNECVNQWMTQWSERQWMTQWSNQYRNESINERMKRDEMKWNKIKMKMEITWIWNLNTPSCAAARRQFERRARLFCPSWQSESLGQGSLEGWFEPSFHGNRPGHGSRWCKVQCAQKAWLKFVMKWNKMKIK